VLDITQIKRVQAELETALDKAKESDRLKSAFLAQMSHEIRTPLNVILPAIPIIADEIGMKDTEMVSILNAVDNAGKRLHRTIDMILSMSAVQSGNYKAKFEKFNLAEDLKSLTKEFTNLGKEKGLEIFFTNNSSGSEISADRYTIGHVFQNLIGNAVKYTQRGHVSVTIDDYEDNRLIIKVEDTGIGMSEKYLKNLFTPFSQEDAGQTRKYEGNGLGLALVKEYVTLNKGIITVQSEKNKGSLFSVIFEKKIIKVTPENKHLMLNEV
jgi:signal transduction histidine kinase